MEIDNWATIVGLLIIVLGAVVVGSRFVNKDKEQKIEAIREWLKYGVTVTEKALGSGTGELKLRMLYSMLTSQFPYAAKLVSFEQFSKLVDEALVWMRHQLENNPNTRAVVLGLEAQ